MNTISQIAFPDFEIVGMKKIHACLRKFGLNDDEFTLAPAIGGILVYDIKQDLSNNVELNITGEKRVTDPLV